MGPHSSQNNVVSNRRQQPALAILAGSLFLAVTACSGSNDMSAGAAQQMQQQAARVEVMRAEPQSVGSLRVLPGRTTPFAQAEIRPQVTGLIQSRLFTEGQQVEAGQPLYQIDPAEYQSAVESARAALARAEAAAGTAKETARRFERLAGFNAVSQQSYDEAVAAQKQAEADTGIQRAALDRARIDLARTKVSSPISGQIGRSSVTPGALVTANQATPIARVLQLDPIYVDMTAASTELLRWKQDVASGKILTDDATGSVPVTVRFEDGSAYEKQGRIEFSEVSVDQTAGTVVVRAQVPNPDGLLLPGMFLKAEFAAGSYHDVYLVPQRAVQRTPTGQAYVFVASTEGKAEQRMVTIQESSGSNWIVTSGLMPGEQVIIEGLQSVRPGVPVQVIGTNPASVTAMRTTEANVSPE